MKNLATIFGVLLFASILFVSCGIGSLENNSWHGEEIMAGAKFDFKLETKSDHTYKLSGLFGGKYIDERGSYKAISDTEIILLTGDLRGYKFIKEESSLKMYMDTGDLFMTLY